MSLIFIFHYYVKCVETPTGEVIISPLHLNIDSSNEKSDAGFPLPALAPEGSMSSKFMQISLSVNIFIWEQDFSSIIYQAFIHSMRGCSECLMVKTVLTALCVCFLEMNNSLQHHILCIWKYRQSHILGGGSVYIRDICY